MARLTKAQSEAAALLAEDRLSNDEIAAKVGVSRKTLTAWGKLPEFAGRIEALRDQAVETIEARTIGQLETRVDALNDRWLRMQRVIDQRATDPSLADIAGADTGLICLKTITKTGDRIYGVDTSLLHELREHEKQAAQELGQWKDRREDTVHQKITITTITPVKPTPRDAE